VGIDEVRRRSRRTGYSTAVDELTILDAIAGTQAAPALDVHGHGPGPGRLDHNLAT
jgi:hypothetical protein